VPVDQNATRQLVVVQSAFQPHVRTSRLILHVLGGWEGLTTELFGKREFQNGGLIFRYLLNALLSPLRQVIFSFQGQAHAL